jgi:hypothetical protein
MVLVRSIVRIVLKNPILLDINFEKNVIFCNIPIPSPKILSLFSFSNNLFEMKNMGLLLYMLTGISMNCPLA